MKILHDLHTHNVYSYCCQDRTASTKAFIEKEVELGHKIFGLSNHIWDERVPGASPFYDPQTIALAEEAKASFHYAPDSLKVLFGAETEFAYYKGILGMTREGATHFDYLLIPHSHIHQRNFVIQEIPDAVEMRENIRARVKAACPELPDDLIGYMINGLKERYMTPLMPEIKADVHGYLAKQMVDSFNALIEHEDVLAIAKTIPVAVAHPFAPCGVPTWQMNDVLARIDDETFTDCFTRTAKAGIYMEINVGAVTCPNEDLDHNEMIRVMNLAKKAGCQFTFGTDSHSVNGLAYMRESSRIVEKLKLTPSDLAEFVRDGIE